MDIFALALLAVTTLAPPSAGQTSDPGQTAPANSAPSAPSTTPVPSATAVPPYDRPVSWKLLVPNLIDDQKHIWSFPAKLVHGQDWIPTASVLGTTAGLILFDAHEGSYFQNTQTFHAFNNVFSGRATVIGTIVAPTSLYAIGLIRRDSKMQHTALLAGEAVGDAEILTTFLKDATKRVRPAGFSKGANLNDSWFDSRGSLLRGNGSFPSGHTIAAFAIATVIARRYRNHRWIPYASYGMAAVVAFSRLTLSAHFLSDVFMGGALGYSISRFAVLRQ